jgi:hypothetical protein
MKTEKCLHCKSEMDLYKEDIYRWWYKCGCGFTSTKAKPLMNKTIEASSNTKTIRK